MSDDQNPDPTKTPEDPTPAKKPDPKTEDPSEDSEFDKLSDSSKKHYKALKTEVANRRHENNSLKEELATLKGEKEKAEKERLEKQGEFQKLYEEEKTKGESFRERAIRAEIKALAVKEGLHDPDAAALIPLSGVKFNDDGELLGAEKAVKAFKDSKPTWFTTPAAATPAKPTETGTSKSDPNPSEAKGKSREEVAQMDTTSPEYAAIRANYLKS